LPSAPSRRIRATLLIESTRQVYSGLSHRFIHLHTHSCYSFLDAVPSPAELAHAAARSNMPALALTDHHGLTGAVEFYDACQQQGVRPILGLELHIVLPSAIPEAEARAYPLVLLAMDMNGWASLCRLSTLAHAAQAGQPQVDFQALDARNTGLLCLSGGWRGAPARLVGEGRAAQAERWLAALYELFGDRLYVELPAVAGPESAAGRGLNESLARMAARQRWQVVATNNVHMLDQRDAALQRLLAATRVLAPLNALSPDDAAPPGSAWADEAEMRRRLPGLERALFATADVANRCHLQLPLGLPHYPRVALPDGLTAAEALRRQAEAGARKLYGEVTSELCQRLDHELDVIVSRGYAPLFLIMQEVVGFARQSGVPISSRGSAASSLVAHCLGITSPDPMRLSLYFERFLNPARASPPDIDTDLCSRRREMVIRHVFETYGQDHVAMVATVNRFRERSSLRETARAFGLAPAQVKALADALPHRGWGPPGDEPQPEDTPLDGLPPGFAALAATPAGAGHRPMLQLAARMLGLPRHLSVHPGGVVISPGPLTDLAPIQVSASGMPIVQFDLGSVARLGLAKIDLLGIRGLTVLGDIAAALAPAQLGGESPLSVLDAIPDDDGPTQELLRTGRTIGCFQVESPGMRATLREVNASSVDDIMVALALYRPGPLSGGLKDAFVRRHLGKEPVTHLHPALASLLGDTYGVILYQEQVLRLAHELAGLSLADSDLLRRAMSHFDPGQQMQTLRQRFLAGAEARHGVPADVAERVWELMAAFAGYGFPKAHAASYALVAWRAAWCKAHFPAIFMAAVLANWGGYYSQRVYLTEARRLSLRLQPPHINHAQDEFSVAHIDGEPRLVMGLSQVRELSGRTRRRIIRQRPFTSLVDFVARADPRPLEAENLVRVGALDGLGTIPTLLRQLTGRVRAPGQMQLFSLGGPAQDDWTLVDKVAAQEALLGASIDAHPLELVSDAIAAANAHSTVAAAARPGDRVRVAGMRQTWRRTATTRGDHLYFMSLEDLDGMLDVVIFGDVYRRYRSAFVSSRPIVLEGVVEIDIGRGEPAIRAERAWPIG
jgi:DNA polymerase III subunit alpha